MLQITSSNWFWDVDFHGTARCFFLNLSLEILRAISLPFYCLEKFLDNSDQLLDEEDAPIYLWMYLAFILAGLYCTLMAPSP